MSRKNKLLSFFALLFITVVSLFRSTFIADSPPSPPPPKAAIIPHHLVAQSFIKDLGFELSGQKNLSQIIIIGPNHDEVGDKHFSSDPDLLARDHACYAPLEILKNYLPNVKISCVLISSRATPSEINDFANDLSSTLGESGVLIASVDFSHYQTLEQANDNDLTTQKYLESFNAAALAPLGNSYLDSPNTIAALFKYLSLRSISKFTLVNHSNSALILNDLSLPSTTSYFEYIYY
jgi:predicted class III extradiol MEMO1 family dioxygenase